jgi:lon-related putative ATP-dependent protease
MYKELSAGDLQNECDPKLLSFNTTEEISPLKAIIGQERAVKALQFGLEMKEFGFNIYVAGQPGTGRETATREFLEDYAKTRSTPFDLCYVNNFQNQYEPKAIQLPPGKGKEFRKDIDDFINETKRVLPEAFKSDDYATRRDEVLSMVEEERKKLYADLKKRAEAEGFTLQITPTGLLMIPVVDGKPLNEQDFLALPSEKREEIQTKKEKLGENLRVAVRQLRSLEGKADELLKKLNRSIALFVLDHLNNALEDKYKEFDAVIEFLKDVQEDILENITEFLKLSDDTEKEELRAPWSKEMSLRKYAVNVIVDNSGLEGAPVIIEHNPTYSNLVGRIEKEAQLGILTTDFTMIRAGSLHKANGGFLVMTVEEIIRNLFSWDALKNALKNEKIIIEEATERLGYITTRGLRPEPVPLNIKVILIGTPLLYHLLFGADSEFKELFKVKADFDTAMDRTEENIRMYAAFVCTLCRKESLKHHDRSAVMRVIAYGSRLAADKEKLSTRFADIGDIIREANYYATKEGSEYITAAHVEKAVEEKVYRSSLIKEKVQEMIDRRTILIDTEGEKTGQVNGLSITGFGDYIFGRPSRVTASIGMGKGGIVDIEREAKLGGPIHTKGVLILSGYLAEKFAKDKPISLSARLVFEQSYGGIEGDSASSTELYALLSALSGQKIKQSIAVTGSVNQKGEIQAIGGVNEKIEGFFEVCNLRGLNGKQGVVIPQSNVKNLMLKQEVIDAVEEGRFHIFPVSTIDEGIEILTGVGAGGALPDGSFEEGTINDMVNSRLLEIAERAKQFPESEKKREESSKS